MSLNDRFLKALRGGLIVSCQPVDGGPLDTVEAIVGFARAAESAGARGLRIEGAAHVSAVTQACDLPVIGIVKRDLPDSPVRITPFLEDITALADAGATVIAVDATARARPVTVADLLTAIHDRGCLAMADLSTEAEAKIAHELGFDILGTTMSGYTGGPVPVAPDLGFVAACRRLGGTVIAEGRYNTPDAAASAIEAGADAVCVGSAITRTEHVTDWFRTAIDTADRSCNATTLAIDVGGTKTLAALVRGGKVLERREIPTPDDVGSDRWFDAIGTLVANWRGQYDAIGAAVTGVVRDGLWSALNPATLSIPARTPLVAGLTEIFGVPVTALNDAQAAAWGEYRYGAGRNSDMVFITVSSGIGGGMVLHGRLVQGANGIAGSLGQITGSVGAERLETRASGFGIATSAAALGRATTTHEVFAALEEGLSWADTILDAVIEDLAVSLSDLQRLIDPQVVVLGGGIGLLPQFRERLTERLSRVPCHFRPIIKAAALGGDAGVVGIADFCRMPPH